MPNPSLFIQARASRFACQGNPSTGFVNARRVWRVQASGSPTINTAQIPEDSLVTGLCGLAPALANRWARPCAIGERNESVGGPLSSIGFSNRKDRQKAGLEPLLKTPNAARMARFADGQCHGSAGSDEQVMDRGTECVAGGSDAI